MKYRVQLNPDTGQVIYSGGLSVQHEAGAKSHSGDRDWLTDQLKKLMHRKRRDPMKPRKWCSDREIKAMEQGRVPNISVQDVQAVRMGQAEKRMRDYARPVRVWELDDGQRTYAL